MNICFCCHAFYPSTGGVENVVMHISKNLIKQGHNVTVITSANSNYPLKEKINGINVIRLKPICTVFKVPIVLTISKVLSKLDIDVLHVHGTIPGFSDVPVFWAKKHNIPCVLTYHFDGNADNFIGTIFAYIYNNTINKIVVSMTDRITATSHSYAKTSPVLKNYLNKTTIIPNGVHIEKFFNVNEKAILAVKKKYNLQGQNSVLFVGRIVKYKGLDYLIKAMDYIDNAVLVVAGKGYVDKDSIDESKVRLLGYVPDKDLPALFAASTVYCLSSISRGENFGITLLEAMASGTPCVYTDISGKDHMNDTYSLKAKAKDSKDLAKKINLLLKDKKMSNKLSNKAKKAVEEYCWSKIFPKYLKVYSTLLNKRK